MVDLDELAVAVTLAGPDHDTRSDRDDLGAFAAGEIDAFVERAAAREWVGPAAERRRDVARRDGTALGPHLVAQLAVQHQVLEHRELAAAVIELLGEHVERADDAVDLHRLRVRERLFGAAERRGSREIEFAVLEAGHLSQASAERIEAHDVRIHLADAQCERIDVLLERAASAVDDGLLLRELVAPGIDLRLRVADAESARRRDAAVKRRGSDEQSSGDEPEPDAPRRQAHVAKLSPIL